MRVSVAVLVIAFAYPTCSHAAVTEYWFRDQWQTAVGPHTAITFQGYPKNTLIDDEFRDLGVLFPDGNDIIEYDNSLLNDGVGLLSNDLVHGIITLDFAQPMTAVAADFQGIMDIWLYANGQLIWDSTDFSDTASRFGGVTSTVPFDRVLIRDPSNGVIVIDDLYFGGPVPAPGALALFACAALASRRRARRE